MGGLDVIDMLGEDLEMSQAKYCSTMLYNWWWAGRDPVLTLEALHL